METLIVAADSQVSGLSQHEGTFTRVLNFGGLLQKRTRQPQPSESNPSRSPFTEPAFGISLFVSLGVAGCSVLPWSISGGRYQTGFASWTIVESVEIPNALVFAATVAVALLMKFRLVVHPVRSHLISLVLTGAAIALIGTILGGYPVFEFAGGDISTIRPRLTIVPFLVLGLLIFQALEILLRLLRLLVQPVVDYAVIPMRDHFRFKEEQRRQWWRDRWKDARSIFGASKDESKK
jgi:hypothetical protein